MLNEIKYNKNPLIKKVSCSDLRNYLKETLDFVTEENMLVQVTRRQNESVVIMSKNRFEMVMLELELLRKEEELRARFESGCE